MDAAKMAGRILGGAGLLLAAAAGTAQAGGSGTQGGGVVVHRGADIALETNVSAGTVTDEHGVAVHRGQVPARRLKAAVRDNPRRFAVTAGEEIWFVESETGRITVCELRKTSTVGKSVVACHRGRLPRRNN